MPNGKRVTQFVALLVLCGAGALSGCQQEKKVIDIEAPGVDIEVRKPADGPKIEIETRGN